MPPVPQAGRQTGGFVTLRGLSIWLLALVVGLAFLPSIRRADAAVPVGTCQMQRSGAQVTLDWVDDGATFVIRRNGTWLATPGAGVNSFVDQNAPADAHYEVKAWSGGTVATWPCVSGIAAGECSVSAAGAGFVIRWVDIGGTYVLRRNGSWLASPAPGATSYTDANAPANSTYQLVRWVGGQRTTAECTQANGAPGEVPQVQRVIHISIDALRSDHVTRQLAPNLVALRSRSASTMNARTDADVTKTLPNHTSQWTGRPVYGAAGHHIWFNVDDGTTVHVAAGHYVASIFDVVHDHGARTALYVSKDKFDMLDRSWNGANGAVDVTGVDNGRDKIDIYSRRDAELNFNNLADALSNRPELRFAAFHIPYPDTAGHEFGWSSGQYDEAVTRSDALLGRIVNLITSNPTWASSTMIIVTADHGGPNTGLLHDDQTLSSNYTVPFVVWGPGITAADLYAINQARRVNPGTGNPPTNTAQLPIRSHEVANLALEALGLGPVPGSVANAQQNLIVVAP